jgi:hypothetical protein
MLGGAQQRLQLVDGQAVVGLAADWAPGDQAAVTQTGQVPETVGLGQAEHGGQVDHAAFALAQLQEDG